MSSTPCIGLIGGMSWESTAVYYRLLNEQFVGSTNEWQKPHIILDSLDFGEIVAFQQRAQWNSTAEILMASARRLEASGATVLAITANTMHINAEDVQNAVSIPLIDIRDSVSNSVKDFGEKSVALLGTKYLVDGEFFSSHLERSGIHVVKPDQQQRVELQRIVFEELTQGIISENSRATLIEIGEDCRQRGGEVVALCCTEFGLLINEANAPFPYIDSTITHAKDLLKAIN